MANEKETKQAEQKTPETKAVEEKAVAAPQAKTSEAPKPKTEDKPAEKPQEVKEEAPKIEEPVAAQVAEEAPVQAYTPPPAQPSLGSVVETAKKQEEEKKAAGIFGIYKAKFESFAQEMRPGKRMDTTTGSAHQWGLYQNLLQIFKLPPQDFFRAWNDFLSVVLANEKGAFDEKLAYRFIADIKFLDQTQKNAFRNTLRLAIATADPKGRRVALKSLDVPSAVLNIPVPGILEKMQAFYDPR